MRTIARTTPPACLDAQPAHQPWDAFAGQPCHAAVTTALREEQHQLCCYCESELLDGDCHVEHVEPRSANPGRTYDYDNLAASCNGGAIEHCGHFKDNHHRNRSHRYDPARFVPPHDTRVTNLFRYRLDGSLDATEELDANLAASASYMIGYLGLGCPRLTERRKAHARELMAMIGDASDSSLVAWARDFYLQPGGDGRLRKFFSLSKAILEP